MWLATSLVAVSCANAGAARPSPPAIATGNRNFIAFIVRPLAGVYLELVQQIDAVHGVVAVADRSATHFEVALPLAAKRKARREVPLYPAGDRAIALAFLRLGADSRLRRIGLDLPIVAAGLAVERNLFVEQPLAEQ